MDVHHTKPLPAKQRHGLKSKKASNSILSSSNKSEVVFPLLSTLDLCFHHDIVFSVKWVSY
jgi:hypothetical protein